jgi:hemerythrin-like domain-containing protein
MEKPWADQPFALLTIPGSTPIALKTSNPGVMSVCIEMANVHNTLLRGLNSIYLQAPHVSELADIMDLMFYTKAWAASVHVHHASEETVFFPKVDAWAKEARLDAGLMEGNIEQHHAFETGLEETLKWSEEVRAGTKAFDAKKLIGLIDTFAPLLTQHLHDEIDTLIRLEKCDGEKVRKAFKLTADESLKKASLVCVFIRTYVHREKKGLTKEIRIS